MYTSSRARRANLPWPNWPLLGAKPTQRGSRHQTRVWGASCTDTDMPQQKPEFVICTSIGCMSDQRRIPVGGASEGRRAIRGASTSVRAGTTERPKQGAEAAEPNPCSLSCRMQSQARSLHILREYGSQAPTSSCGDVKDITTSYVSSNDWPYTPSLQLLFGCEAPWLGDARMSVLELIAGCAFAG